MPRLDRTSSKRKVDESEESDRGEGGSQSQELPKAKKVKKGKGEEALPEYTGPTNKVLPVKIEFPAKDAGAIRIAAWNLSGYAASMKKGFSHYVAAEDADILIITETKLNQAPDNMTLKLKYPHQYWSAASKKGYAGTAVLSKEKPLSVQETLPNHPVADDVKGRMVILEFKTCYVVGTYVTNAGQKLKTLEEKKVWNTHFFAYLHELDKSKPVIWAGDLNVAPEAIDLANPKPNWNKTAGYTEAETSAFRNFLTPPDDEDATTTSNKFLDIWRNLHPQVRGYTYFSYRFNCRDEGLGWRIDGFVLSERLKERVKMCEIRDEIYGASDHVPIVMEIEGEL